MEANGVFVKIYKESVSQLIVQNLLSHFAAPLINLRASADYEILTAVCFLCDVLESGGPTILNLTA